MRSLTIVAILLPLLAWLSHVDAEGIEKKQTSNTTASPITSSALSLSTPSQAPTQNSSAYDLTQHFCRLYRHANVNLLVLDLSKNFTENDTFPYRTIHKPPGVPPALEDSALWYSAQTQKIYQLGGWYSRNGNPSTVGYVQTGSIPPATIWEFDIDTELWANETEFQTVDTGEKIDRPGAAAHCDAPALNQSFIFEGFVQQFSDPDYVNYSLYSTYKYLEGMLRLDTSDPISPILTNVSIPTFLRQRTDGSMIYVPVGPKGILVLIGGQTTSNPNTPWGIAIDGASGGNIMINMTSVDIYDIESGYWFSQTTFDGGDGIPAGRGALCLALIAAADGSSWNILMVGGISTFAGNGPTTTKQIWVLSLPTFQWIKLYQEPGALYRHTCHLVGENLLIIAGMERTLPNGVGDSQDCQNSMPAKIFSIPLMNYTGQFDYAGSLRPALVPSKIVSAIGGSPSGGALKTSPLVWDYTYLQYIFNPALTRPPYTPDPTTYILANTTNNSTSTSYATPTQSPSPTSSPKTGSNHTGAIVGGAVGGVAGLAILGFLVFCCCFRRKHEETPDGALTSELPSYMEAKEVPDRNNRYEPPRIPPLEMPTPGSPTPIGWHEPRIGERADNVSPLAGDQDGNDSGIDELGAAGGGTRSSRIVSDSMFSQISDESGHTAVKSSPGASPRIPRKSVGAASK